MTIMEEALKELKKVPIIKLIAVRFGYVLGLFTVVYLVLLVYDLIFGFNPASEYSALIIAVIAAGITAIDMALLWSEKVSPAMIVMVLWVSPLYVLYKFFKHAELLNLNSTYLPKRTKQYLTTSALIKTG